MFSFLLGRYLGVEFLNHMVGVALMYEALQSWFLFSFVVFPKVTLQMSKPRLGESSDLLRVTHGIRGISETRIYIYLFSSQLGS